ncbi:FAD-dependent monooxygenase [Rhizobium sp. KVB221]|uniref:FAD-dependent monooxygenase n=1 Tax=Rhizobium setariae TaxID=2801340 RepID=A0A937CQG3_9HYPH|nr:FAD-dependent monooxygenase [Rhizobium setariae]MBL0372967.1 FAD-dependent monooxygenase [Rhizobium setariae]
MKSVAIVGAGIAGLVGALAFARKGVRCVVVERVAHLQEVGAGLQLSPNANYVLDKLGLSEALRPLWREPDNICLVSGMTLAPISAIATSRVSTERWGSPYAAIHRATLQKVLLDAVRAEPLITLSLDTRVTTEAGFRQITGEAPDLMIGADGVWSEFRNHIPQAGAPEFSGMVAWRFIIPEKDAPSFLNPRNVTAFIGPKAHIVAYPLQDAGAFNVVALSSGKNPGETWAADCNPMNRSEMTSQFSSWHRDIRTLVAYAPRPTWWPLFGVSEGRWTDGEKRVLIGDAAHAMTPFAAQGAAMAIEDAYELAGITTADVSLGDALNFFERHRQMRVSRVRLRGAFNKFAYHARGPVRMARDLVLKVRGPQNVAADLDWLYGYKAPG